MKRNLELFQSHYSFQEKVKIGSWVLVQRLVFSSLFTPSFVRSFILKLFGAKIGPSVFIRRDVRIQFPWNLQVGESCWLGEGVRFINHAPIEIGSNVCISQNVTICSSGHDYKSVSLQYRHKPIVIKDGAWICLNATVLGGSEIGFNSVVSAGEIFSGTLPNASLFIKGTSKFIDEPKLD